MSDCQQEQVPGQDWWPTALDSVYRERARLVGHLCREYPAVWYPPQEQGDPWWLIFLDTPAGQLSWHVHARDRDVFPEGIAATGENPWDGHDTAEKYRRLSLLP